ncbi:c-type cytochrome [Magnetovirga frankeli]|uniref:c-type cytochrome n=1 Tax=Magnetovirga frankeli TaxID=947516 RepID=UPI0012931C7B|nr:c-type cytochrome [gamma proteobacterium SS-5]
MKNRILLGLILLTSGPLLAEDSAEALVNYQPELDTEVAEMIRQADPAQGQRLFLRKCSSCHDTAKGIGHGKGPNLWGLLNRPAGRAQGFAYSEALQQANFNWTYANLNYYLTRTDRAIPGVAMNFRGIKKDSQRARLIAYLRTRHDNPPPLP